MRAEGLIPAETIFKFSVFGGLLQRGRRQSDRVHGGQLHEPHLRCVSADSRLHPESRRPAAGCLSSSSWTHSAACSGPMKRLKSPGWPPPATSSSSREPRKATSTNPGLPKPFTSNLIREKVKIASIVMEIMQKHGPGFEEFPQKGRWTLFCRDDWSQG